MFKHVWSCCLFMISSCHSLSLTKLWKENNVSGCHQISWKKLTCTTARPIRRGKRNWWSVEQKKGILLHLSLVACRSNRGNQTTREVDVPYHQPDPPTSRRQTKQNSVNKNSRGQICCVVYCFNSRPLHSLSLSLSLSLLPFTYFRK